MGCNCNSGKTKAQHWVHVAPNGAKTTYATYSEAEAARIRKGGQVKAA